MSFLALCTVVFQLMLAAPAAAWFDWLDEFSGPGPFHSVAPPLRVRLWCFDEDKSIPASPLIKESSAVARSAVAVVGVGGCLLPLGITAPKTSINFEWGHLKSVENHLVYAAAVDRRVTVNEFAGSISHFLDDKRIVEGEAGLGQMRVSSPKDVTFPSFWRTFGEISVNVTPLAGAKWAGRWGRLVVLRSELLVVPQGFESKDFNSTPGFDSGVDVLKSQSILFDFSSVLFR